MSTIVLGKSGQRNIHLDIDTLLRTRLLIQANSGGGKSFLLRRIAEQLYGKIPVHILDPEGEFATLREKYGYVLIGEGGDAAADIRSAGLVAQRLLELRVPAVIDLYEAFRSKPSDRRLWVRKYLEALVDAPKSLWKPLVVIVDEAHKFVPQETPRAGSKVEQENIIGCKEAMIALSTVGRKRQFCAVWATQRLAKVDKDASAELLNRLIGPTFEDVDIDRAADMLSVSKDERQEFKKKLRILEPGNFYAIGRAVAKEKVLIRIGSVATTHPDIGKMSSATEVPPPPEKIRKLLPKLADLPKEAEAKEKSVSELQSRVKQLERELKTRPTEQKVVEREKIKTVEKIIRIPEIPREIKNYLVKLEKAIDALSGVSESTFAALKDFKPVANVYNVAPTPVSKFYEKKVKQEIARTSPLLHPLAKSESNGDDSSGHLKSGALRLLAACAQWYPKWIPAGQAASMSKMKARGGSFTNYKSNLVTGGYIETNGNLWRATDKGLSHTGLADVGPAPSTTEEVLALWKTKLKLGAMRVLQTLIDSGEAMTYEELSATVNLRGGSFTNYISNLTIAGLVTKPSRGTIAANREALFL